MDKQYKVKRNRIKFVKRDEDLMTDQEFQEWVDRVTSKPENIKSIVNGTFNKE